MPLSALCRSPRAAVAEEGDHRPNSRPAFWYSLLVLALVVPSGCTSLPLVREPSPTAVPASGASAASSAIIEPGAELGPVRGLAEQTILISSEPSGARILVNNQPMGRAPLRLAVKTSAQGFCADYVTVRARFVAEDATHVSQTVDVQLTPLEKPPGTLVFTPEGFQRRMK